MPRPKRVEEGESLYSRMGADANGRTRLVPDTRPPEIRTMIGEENNMQRIHHIVRTATLDNQFHESGAIPLGAIEKDINAEWLAKGWQMLSTAVLRVGQSEFEILYTLVQNVP